MGFTRCVSYDWLARGKEEGLADRVAVRRSPLAALSEEIEEAVAYAKGRLRNGYRRLATTEPIQLERNNADLRKNYSSQG